MVAPIAIVAVVIAVITIIILVIAMIMFLVLARQLEGTNKNSLTVAGVLIAIAIPFAIVSAITAFMYYSGLAKGEKKKGLRWLMIISTLISGLMIFIGSIIGFVIGGRDDDPTRKRNIQAAAGIAFTMGGLMVILFFGMMFLVKPKKVEKTRSVKGKKTTKSKDVYRKPSVIDESSDE